MSLWSRIANVLRGDRLSREIDEELQSHIEEAIEQGRDPAEARQSVRLRAAAARREPRRPAHPVARFAPRRRRLRLAAAHEEQSDLRGGDPVAGPGDRRVHLGVPAHRRAAAAAFAGSRRRSGCTRLPARQSVPTASSKSSTAGRIRMFRLMRAAVKDQAELIAISYADRTDLTYGSDAGDGESVPAICLGLDVRLLRTAARAGTAVHRKRRSEARRASRTPCSPTIIGRAASGGIRK